ncbi:N-acetylmuramoyl-L-alanine amidase [Clostridium paraputrificum]|uniref:N-acetylmuramoyl-L-alanine amidase n=1 Tax=Clostridium paraputrificum TaxID=29363 RepID=UPI00325A6FFA
MKVRRIIVAVFIALLMIKVPVMAEEVSKGIVLIDAGHGGIDGGAQSKNGTIEKDINLQISKRLKERLEKEGYKVYMTREEDKELSPKKVKDLEARCKMKIETKCDVFISIHQNKFNSEKCFGAQVWYASNEKSMKLAKYVQDSLKEGVKDNNKRLEKAAKEQYKILRDKYEGACLIVECGFLSNNEEEQRLKSESHQNQIVDGITIGINKYFDEIK